MIKATNNFVWIIRDESESEQSGFFIPDQGREKPHTGKIFSIGALVKDKNIKSAKGQTAVFHKGIGFSIEYQGTEYLLLTEEQIIGVDS